MVGTVLVSHSQELTEALVRYTKVMAPEATVVAAGGLPDGGYGTSYRRIKDAIALANAGDGVVVIVDVGSALLTAKMVIEDLEDPKIRIADTPFVEGALEATVLAQSGCPMDEILSDLSRIRHEHKM